VFTDTARVRRCRREVLELLLARCPEAEVVDELAREYGIVEPRYEPSDGADKCILCDVCTRVCQELVTGAIARVNRGLEKKVDTPFAEASADCIGCLSCARSCPTGAIPFVDSGNQRTIWGRTFELVECARCGVPTMTREQAAWVGSRAGMAEDELTLCDQCKVRATGAAHRDIRW